MMQRLLIILTLALTLAGCAGDSASLPFGPVSFRVAKDGQVAVTVGPTFVTPMGDLKVGATLTLIESGEKYWYVIIRRTIDGEEREIVYQLDSEAGLRIESNGELIEEFSRHRVLIEVPSGAEAQINISEIKDGEVSSSRGKVYLVPKEFIGTWSGTMTGGDRRLWSNAPYEYWPNTPMKIRIYGGEIGHPVGEFEYPKWECSGVLVFKYADPDGEDEPKKVYLRHLVLDSGDNQKCGGFIEGGQGDPAQGDLDIQMVDGKLKIETGLVKTPKSKSGEPSKIEPVLTRG